MTVQCSLTGFILSTCVNFILGVALGHVVRADEMSERQPLLPGSTPARPEEPKATPVPWRELIVVCLIRVRFARIRAVLYMVTDDAQSIAGGTHCVKCRKSSPNGKAARCSSKA